MAITRAQQFRQMYQFGGGADAGGVGSPGGGTFGGGPGPGDGGAGRDLDFQQRGMSKTDYNKATKGAGGGAKTLATLGVLSNFINPANLIMSQMPFKIQKGLAAINAINRINDMKKMQSNFDIFGTSDDEKETTDDDTTLTETIGENIRNLPDYTDKTTKTKTRAEELLEEINNMADGGRAGLAGGGMPYEGGIMDFESARQMYGLGKLVKKVTRTVKKIAKSPIGKAALLYAGGTYLGGLKFAGGAGFGSGTFLSNLKSGQGIANLGGFLKGKLLASATTKPGTPSGGLLNLIKSNPTASILGASTLAGLTAKEEEDDTVQTANLGPGLNIPEYRRDPFGNLAIRFRAEGGSTEQKEPVAKKTMPL